MIRKAETTKISIVIENEMLNTIDEVARKCNKTRSEVIREILKFSEDKAVFMTPTRNILSMTKQNNSSKLYTTNNRSEYK